MSVVVQFVDPDGNDIDQYYFKPGLKVLMHLVDVTFERTWWGLGRRAIFTYEYGSLVEENQPRSLARRRGRL